MSKQVELSKQKLELTNICDRLKAQRDKPIWDIHILELGIKQLDSGTDVLNGRSLLTEEIKGIVKKEMLNF